MTRAGDAYRGQRILDLSVALPALILLMPVMVATAASVRLRLGRPVLFRQPRAGLGGQPFTITKFRTMTPERPGEDDAVRITRLGRRLRSWSLDELPELWNVVQGEMSLVGPRPLHVRYIDRYSSLEARRLEVRPGITGLAQVNGRNDSSWQQRFDFDVSYVEHASLGLDIRILIRTIGLVVRGVGVSSPDHATMPEFAPPDQRKVRP